MEYHLKTSPSANSSSDTVSKKPADISLAFDVGHSSIGWAVLKNQPAGPDILGSGAVTFQAEDCLASQRRLFRRQRRHVRSTRQRIDRMEKLLAYLGVFTAEELKSKHAQGQGHPAPWLLAARVLSARVANMDTSPYLLKWDELWDVLRWYAHNRGYDNNRLWARDEAVMAEDADSDNEKVENALELMREHGTHTMAETITAVMFEPHGKLKALDVGNSKLPFFTNKSRYKAKNAAFPRDTVEKEVKALLEAHIGLLEHVTKDLIALLVEDTSDAVTRLRLRGMNIMLPRRFQGGLLFGQLLPRFDNRIISTCPVSGGKVCAKSASEFRLYRWLMQVANVRVVRASPEQPNQLNKTERAALHSRMVERGALTPGEFKAAVKEITGCATNNLETMLMHPDADKALILDPVRKLIHSDRVQFLWPHFPESICERIQKRAAGKWRQGKVLTLNDLLSWCDELGISSITVLKAAKDAITEKTVKKASKAKPINEAELLATPLKIEAMNGRAPFARHILTKAGEEVMAGYDPRKKCRANDPAGGEDKMEDGCLVRDNLQAAKTSPFPDFAVWKAKWLKKSANTARSEQEALETYQKAQASALHDAQTNNHLVRHRLLILQRLVTDIIADPLLLNGDALRITGVAIEVNRELKEMSGKDSQKLEKALNLRLGNFKSVVNKLEEAGILHPSPGLIRKARIAEDLGRMCPYSGRHYDWHDLLNPDRWDKDHIVPYSVRPSNGLDSLVITTKAINLEKKARTGLEFIEWMNQPENLTRRDQLGVCSVKEYKDFVNGLESWKGHDDDVKRKRRRKQLLLLPKWEEKDASFLPRDLTVTSHLVRLGALVLQRSLPHLKPHEITSLPGSVTGAIRTGWKLLGCLSSANAGVLEKNGDLKTKTDIRGVTHLHHALDAIVIGLTHHYFPKSGRLWEAMVRREKQRSKEDNELLLATGLFQTTQYGVVFAKEPPKSLLEQIRSCLTERRVVQHLPSDMSGMLIEQNTRGVVGIDEDGTVHLKQIKRDDKTGKLKVNSTKEHPSRLIGLRPGKLSEQKGVRVIDSNYGVAILDAPPPKADGTAGNSDDRFVVIPFAGVWKRMKELRELNRGKRPIVLRQGTLIQVPKKGRRTDLRGVWMVRGISNKKRDGIILELCWPDVIDSRQTGVAWAKPDASLRTLINECEMTPIRSKLTGLPAFSNKR